MAGDPTCANTGKPFAIYICPITRSAGWKQEEVMKFDNSRLLNCPNNYGIHYQRFTT